MVDLCSHAQSICHNGLGRITRFWDLTNTWKTECIYIILLHDVASIGVWGRAHFILGSDTTTTNVFYVGYGIFLFSDIYISMYIIHFIIQWLPCSTPSTSHPPWISCSQASILRSPFSDLLSLNSLFSWAYTLSNFELELSRLRKEYCCELKNNLDYRENKGRREGKRDGGK